MQRVRKKRDKYRTEESERDRKKKQKIKTERKLKMKVLITQGAELDTMMTVRNCHLINLDEFEVRHHPPLAE